MVDWQPFRQRWVDRLERLHARYGRLFWTLHSVWALLTGVLVLVLAHNRYGYIRWVVLFLALTWASTLFFSRFSQRGTGRMFVFAQGFVSYLTRVLYQETLFFLLPFYFYSTTFPSWNALFILVLAGLAVFSCIDLPFDRLFRSSKLFALSFFALVTFSALIFFFPFLVKVRTHHGLYLAAVLSFFAALPLAMRLGELKEPRKLGAGLLVLVLILGLVRLARPLIPPVPLRLAKVRFSTQLDPRTLRVARDFERDIPAAELTAGRLYAVVTVFSPVPLPTSLVVRWQEGGRTLRSSRAVEVMAHARGFRVWDALNLQRTPLKGGRYRLEVWTAEGQLLGKVPFRVVPSPEQGTGDG
ncbi:MAG: DUF5924 family protein [Thermoanaerobaculum sp.]|nr:DUF5924 family protein [Thermoanaerobaculum sp.]MDW7966980.1 DUF5924 family protein [Thermoanaerobaculum sp.]